MVIVNPSNGKVELSSPLLNGSVAVYSCDEASILGGEETVTCLYITCLNNFKTVPENVVRRCPGPPICNGEK